MAKLITTIRYESDSIAFYSLPGLKNFSREWTIDDDTAIWHEENGEIWPEEMSNPPRWFQRDLRPENGYEWWRR